ncbi:MAG: type-F conjugative transfer system secretin TraK [Candidatus Omnitrophica bacterium]|nr:type-F conjugative transfer system secretin TraK [Candidatus Omnitrophota bacterium]
MTILLICVFAVGTVFAKDIPEQEPSTTVHVAVGKVSEVFFPGKIAKVVKGGASDSVLIEVLDQSLYLLPKSNAPADIFVTTVSGRSYPLTLTVAPQHDIKVEIGGGSVGGISPGASHDVMDVMKDILSGHEPPGSTALKVKRADILFKDSKIRLYMRSGYDLPALTAYILEARNLTDNSVIVPIEQVTFPRLLAITSDRDMIAPKGREGDSTAVYLVVGE